MDSKRWNSKELQNPKLHPHSNLGPRCEASGKTIVLPRLGPCVEARNETRSPSCGEEECGWQEFCDFELCLKISFGTSVNAFPNFSTIMGGKKYVLRKNGRT
ncbi:hypothetical protein AVEN_42225-1 [Araneus ventricosus]|uniref:Uncharacterized protein n=1 Tax=Araneus ventricosus TaxID=182803 RepID=A0A4Y2AY28_ARAVE|nr:hypothetical protein AVEN_42225-1 [Araneus ventricosus]